MGRTIIIEESVAEYISSLYGKHQWQLGLLIGQVRVFISPLTVLSHTEAF